MLCLCSSAPRYSLEEYHSYIHVGKWVYTLCQSDFVQISLHPAEYFDSISGIEYQKKVSEVRNKLGHLRDGVKNQEN